jgi:hypothetical protein
MKRDIRDYRCLPETALYAASMLFGKRSLPCQSSASGMRKSFLISSSDFPLLHHRVHSFEQKNVIFLHVLAAALHADGRCCEDIRFFGIQIAVSASL